MPTRKASIKETGEELSPKDWERFDAAVAEVKSERNDETSSDATEEQPQDVDGAGQASGGGRLREES